MEHKITNVLINSDLYCPSVRQLAMEYSTHQVCSYSHLNIKN